jgi:hypothetical protein
MDLNLGTCKNLESLEQMKLILLVYLDTSAAE